MNTENIKTESDIEVEGFKVHSELPKDVFKQQDLYVLLMLWHRNSNMDTWSDIRKFALDNSSVTDNVNIKMKPNELPLKVLDALINNYIEMALAFFTSRLA